MIAIWMVYACFVGLVVFGVGRAIEELARLADRPRRWVWVGAMALSLGFPLALFAFPSLGAARRMPIAPWQVAAGAGAPVGPARSTTSPSHSRSWSGPSMRSTTGGPGRTAIGRRTGPPAIGS